MLQANALPTRGGKVMAVQWRPTIEYDNATEADRAEVLAWYYSGQACEWSKTLRDWADEQVRAVPNESKEKP